MNDKTLGEILRISSVQIDIDVNALVAAQIRPHFSH